MILIIDDDLAVAETVLGYLENILPKEKAAIVTNPQAAKHLISVNRFKLILMDIAMPSINGLELLEEIKAYPKGPIIMMSGINELFTEEFNSYPDVATLEKPFEEEMLQKVIKNVLPHLFK